MGIGVRGQSSRYNILLAGPQLSGHLEGMARSLRIEYPGALYHVMARGDGGRRVFESEDDAQSLLELLGRACERCGWRVHAWVLMSNHSLQQVAQHTGGHSLNTVILLLLCLFLLILGCLGVCTVHR